jgi:hypothetical protein
MQPFSSGHQTFGGQIEDFSQSGMGYASQQQPALLLQRSNYQALYAQFQNRYPTGALLSELLQIHDGKFIVRVLAQAGGATLATGLAAAYTPEMAEDNARVRALEVLGISLRPQEVHAELVAPPLQTQNAARSLREQDVNTLQGSLLGEIEEIDHTVSHPPALAAGQSLTVDFAPDHPELNENRGSEPALDRDTSKRTGKASQRLARKSDLTASSPAANETFMPARPIDLSDIIAQTSVEMKRLGWREAQGRTHLQRTYNKRSRQQLTDSELLDFLRYLEAQPSASPSLF